MAQGHKDGAAELKAKLQRNKAKSGQWVYWAIGGVIALAIIVPLALAVPSFLPKGAPTYGSVPSAAEQEGAPTGADALPKMSKEDRQIIIDAAKNDGVVIGDDTNVGVSYEKDTDHAVVSVPTGEGKTFRVKTYRLARQGDGGWALQ